MTLAKNVLGIVPGVMALGLVSESGKTVKDIGKGKKSSSKKLVKLGITSLVAIPMIGEVSKQVNLLP